MKKLSKGFTLAELLVVVAIIAVLVAISIPIFTSQLEASREATDLANIRAAYAEVMAAGLTEDTSMTNGTSSSPKNELYYVLSNGKVERWEYDYEVKQKEDGWQSVDPETTTVGGEKLSDFSNNVYAGQTVQISFYADGTVQFFHTCPDDPDGRGC